MSEILIINDTEKGDKFKLYIDGEEIKNLTSINFTRNIKNYGEAGKPYCLRQRPPRPRQTLRN